MPRIDLRDAIVNHFVEGQNQIISRSWSALAANPIFIKSQLTRALTMSQLIRDFDRPIVVFEVDLKHLLFTEKLFWIFDYGQIFHMLHHLMKRDQIDTQRSPQELTDEEQAALQSLADHGGKALVRGIKGQDKIEIGHVSTKISCYAPEEFDDFVQGVSEGLCRVVQGDFEIFGSPESVMVTVFPMPLVEGLHVWFTQNVDTQTLRSWHPIGDRKLQILVADGSEMSRRAIQEALQEFAVQVIVARNGEEAMHLSEKSPPDLIICDLNMPRVNAVNFAKWARSQDFLEKVPLIFCGQMPNRDVLLESVRAGMNEFIVKPPDTQKIRKIILEYLPEAVD